MKEIVVSTPHEFPHIYHDIGTPKIYTNTGLGPRKNREMAGVDDLVVYMQTAVKYSSLYIHHPGGASRTFLYVCIFVYFVFYVFTFSRFYIFVYFLLFHRCIFSCCVLLCFICVLQFFLQIRIFIFLMFCLFH